MSTSNFAVTRWRCGTWGLRVHEEGRAIFQRHRRRLDQEPLVVVLPGATAPLRIHLSPSFWQKCPEVRAAEVGRWMRSRGGTPWPQGRPPTYRASLAVRQEIVLEVG